MLNDGPKGEALSQAGHGAGIADPGPSTGPAEQSAQSDPPKCGLGWTRTTHDGVGWHFCDRPTDHRGACACRCGASRMVKP